MKTKLLITFLISLTLLSCMRNYDDENAQRSRIVDIIENVRIGFIQFNPDKIMSNYHPDYRHFGIDYTSQRFIWQNETLKYNYMEVEILEIDLFDDYAIARFLLKYRDTNNTYGPYVEPDYQGYFSYFYYEKGEWWIYGNQQRH